MTIHAPSLILTERGLTSARQLHHQYGESNTMTLLTLDHQGTIKTVRATIRKSPQVRQLANIVDQSGIHLLTTSVNHRLIVGKNLSEVLFSCNPHGEYYTVYVNHYKQQMLAALSYPSKQTMDIQIGVTIEQDLEPQDMYCFTVETGTYLAAAPSQDGKSPTTFLHLGA